MSIPNFKLMEIGSLRPDPENVRSSMDEQRIEWLKNSILEHGIRQPLEVYMVESSAGTDKLDSKEYYEIVTGHRRFVATERLLEKLEAAISAGFDPDASYEDASPLESRVRTIVNTSVEEGVAAAMRLGECDGSCVVLQEAFLREAHRAEPRKTLVTALERKLKELNCAVLGQDDQEQVTVAELKALLEERRTQIPVRVLVGKEIEDRKYLQLIENLQREDVAALDEARGYLWLVENHHDTPKSIAEKVGVSRKHVLSRLRVPTAPQSLLAALEAGKVSAKHCELVGRLPSEEDRETLTERILKPQYKAKPLNAEEVEDLIERDYMIRLNPRGGCGFDIEDAELVPEAGPCTTCKYLAKNAEDVETSGGRGGKRGIDPNMCLNPACFRGKARAALEALAKDGERVMDDSEAELVFAGDEGSLTYDSDYVDLHDTPTDRETGHYGKVGKWKMLLHGTEIPVILARNPVSGKLVELADRDMAIDAVNAKCKAQGKPSPFAKSNADDEEKKAENERKREEKREREKYALLGIEALFDAVRGGEGLQGDDIRALVGVMLQDTPDALWIFERWLSIKEPSDEEVIETVMEQMKDRTMDDQMAFLMCSILAYGLRWRGNEDPNFAVFAERFGVRVEVAEAD